MEVEVEVDEMSSIPEILVEMIQTEKENFDMYELGTDEHKMAVNNVKTLIDAFATVEKGVCDDMHATQQLEQEKEFKEKQLALDSARMEIDKDSAEIEAMRYEMDRSSRHEELKLKRRETYGNLIVAGASIMATLIGIGVGSHLTNKTLDVNLESCITNRDSVNAANKVVNRFLDRCFIFKK